jgi:dihydrofolate reductase
MKIIVAACKNFGIGFQNNLPWKLKSDLQKFKNLTIGNGNNAVIMGSNTWKSLPKQPLTNRFNCILSTSLEVDNDNSKVFNNVDTLIDFTKSNNFDDVWVIGGEKIYNLFLEKDLVESIYLTKIYEKYICDTYFNYPITFNITNSSRMMSEKDIIYNYILLEKDQKT